MKRVITLWLFFAGACIASPLIDEPVAELRLNSGKMLTQVMAKSFTPERVMVQHSGGLMSVEYGDFPTSYHPELAKKRPRSPEMQEIVDRARAHNEQQARVPLLLERRVPELQLKSGAVLRSVLVKEYTHEAVVLYTKEGEASVRYEDFPDEYATALLAKRPAPPRARSPFFDFPMPELRLKSGKVLKKAEALRFMPAEIFVAVENDALTVKYEDLPDEFAAIAAKHRPGHPAYEPTEEEIEERKAEREAERKRIEYINKKAAEQKNSVPR